MDLIDTHCHPQFDDLIKDEQGVIDRADAAGVKRMIAVGVDLEDSRKAIDYASRHDNVWASAGVHPHKADGLGESALEELSEILNMSRIVAVGEIGLDYYRLNTSKEAQKETLIRQVKIAQKNSLPIIFHVRDAWSDFWEIFDEFSNLRGIVHSFTGGPKQLQQALTRGLLVALNGIVTFTKDEALLNAARAAPLDSLVLETDAPFLTPSADKGQVCEPRHVRQVAEFLAELRGEELETIATATTRNAEKFFGLTP